MCRSILLISEAEILKMMLLMLTSVWLVVVLTTLVTVPAKTTMKLVIMTKET